MERPFKRPCLSFAHGLKNDDDIDLQIARAQNDLRMKSIFEGIFEKYSKDYSKIGDEIDLRTGHIVVNNGHLMGIESDPTRATEPTASWLFGTELSALDGEFDITGDESLCAAGNQALAAEAAAAQSSPRLEASLVVPDASRAAELSSHVDRFDGDEEEDYDDDDDDDNASFDSLLDMTTTVPHSTSDGEPCSNRPVSANQLSDASPRGSHGLALDSIWRAPDIGRKPITHITTHVSRPMVSSSRFRLYPRSLSPPGTGSLWALPRAYRRKSAKRKDKTNRSASKRTAYSSPPEPTRQKKEIPEPDSSESDDPLQEEWQPSPITRIKAKTCRPTTPSKVVWTCVFCKRSFTSKDYTGHLETTIAAGPSDGIHDIEELKKLLDKMDDITKGSASPLAAAAAPRKTESKSPSPGATTLTITSLLSSAGNHQDLSPRRRRKIPKTTMTPDEVRLVVTLRHRQQKKWKEVADHLPGRNFTALAMWNHLHWTERLSNPPQLSAPWSDAEKTKLEKWKNSRGASWTEICADFPGRSRAQVEFELLHLWTGKHTRTRSSSSSPVH